MTQLAKPFELIKIYVRREPSTESATLALGVTGKFDVQAYKDEACTERFARWSWDQSTKPTRRNKTAMVNCYRWQLVWLDDLELPMALNIIADNAWAARQRGLPKLNPYHASLPEHAAYERGWEAPGVTFE